MFSAYWSKSCQKENNYCLMSFSLKLHYCATNFTSTFTVTKTIQKTFFVIKTYHSVSDPLGKSDPNFEFFGLSMAALVHLYTFSMLKVILPHLCTKKGHERS